MRSRADVETGHRTHFTDKITALSCIKFLILADLAFKAISILITGMVLYVKRDEQCKVPLKTFLGGYILLTFFKAISFYNKNNSFLRIQRIPDFEENTNFSMINNFLEAMTLFWYVIGVHWIQECTYCKEDNWLLYRITILWLVIGMFSFIAPLLGIILLLVLLHYVKPKLPVIEYEKEMDIPDNNHRCTICFDDYKRGDKIKFLPCKHHFHVECIDEWLNIKDSCPLCKKHVNLLYDLIDASDPDL